MLASIEIENFRCIQHAKIDLDERGTGIVGANGAGKTSLLEAIYFLAYGRSFRTGVRAKLVGEGQSFFRIVSQLELDSRRIIAGAEFDGSNTKVRVAGRDETSVSAVAELLPVQVIDPGVHRLVEEGSVRRRRLLDWGVFHVEHDFLSVWRRYQRALAQRNASLRSGAIPKLTRVWDDELATAARRIDEMRTNYAATLQPFFTRVAEHLLGIPVLLNYQRGWAGDPDLSEALNASWDRDARVRTTTVGPHRADLAFRVDGEPARDRVSRGQQKMLAASLVLAQIMLGAQHTARRMCLLLDDPAAELDVDNLGKLLEVIRTVPAQLVVTSLSVEGLRGMRIERTFHVEQGKFAPML